MEQQHNSLAFTGPERRSVNRKRVAADDLLRMTRERYQMLVETVPLGIQENDIDGKITFANRAQHLMLGYDYGELVGQSIWDFLDQQEDKKSLQKMLHTLVVDQPQPRPYVTRNRRKDGTIIDVQVDWSYTRGRSKKVDGFVSVITDITDRTRIEQELRTAKAAAESANTAKTIFLGNLSHEFRTPLNAIIGMASILARADLTKKYRRFARNIKEASDRLLAIVEDLLEFTRLEAGGIEYQEETFEVHSVIAEVIKAYEETASRKRLIVETQIDDGVPSMLIGDYKRLRHILFNVIGNAIKFTDKGCVVVRVITIEHSHARIELRFEVLDTGIGIPAGAEDLVFDSFTQADGSLARPYEGLGLGLSLAKKLVDLMGGTIGVTSSSGNGTTVWFTLPFKLDMTNSDEAFSPFAYSTEVEFDRSLSVLVVGPDTKDHRHTQFELGIEGFFVDHARDKKEAIERCIAHPYDVILMQCEQTDIDRESLVESMRIEHGSSFTIPIIGMSEVGRNQHRAKCQDCKVAECITKPLSRPLLSELVVRSVTRARRD